MAKVRITKEFSFEMAHTLTGYDGICSEIHGHSYRLSVTVAGEPNPDPADPKFGMVMDFGALKKIVNEHIIDRYDHALLIRRTGSNGPLTEMLAGEFGRLQATDFQPTCENLIIRFAEILRQALPPVVELHSLRLHETATSYAEWHANDNLEI
jgi:6-pyruvoyltetrahydropterin/6-carboxytetrahydropterin synthase